jgi:hypothetical protein
VLCSSGKHILTITTASRMTLLVTHNLGKRQPYCRMGKQGCVGYLKLDIMWQKLRKHILIMTLAVRTKLLVTHKFGKKGNYISTQKTGNCQISKIGHYGLHFEFFFSFSFPGIMFPDHFLSKKMFPDHHSNFSRHKRIRRNFAPVARMACYRK